MENIDRKALLGLLSRIENIQAELSALGNELRSLVPSDEAGDGFGSQPSEPIDIAISDIDMGISLDEDQMGAPEAEEPAPAAEPVPEEEDEPAPEVGAVPGDEGQDVPGIEEEPAPIEEEPAPAEEEPAPVEEDLPAEDEVAGEAPAGEEEDDLPFFDEFPEKTAPKAAADNGRKAIVDSVTADTAVIDVMAEKQAWRTDRAGSPVKNVISAISLNDRVLLINVLFKEDPMLFQDTISAFNAMSSFEEAVSYVKEHFPEWNLNSDPVYRLMMAVRRRFS